MVAIAQMNVTQVCKRLKSRKPMLSSTKNKLQARLTKLVVKCQKDLNSHERTANAIARAKVGDDRLISQIQDLKSSAGFLQQAERLDKAVGLFQKRIGGKRAKAMEKTRGETTVMTNSVERRVMKLMKGINKTNAEDLKSVLKLKAAQMKELKAIKPKSDQFMTGIKTLFAHVFKKRKAAAQRRGAEEAKFKARAAKFAAPKAKAKAAVEGKLGLRAPTDAERAATTKAAAERGQAKMVGVRKDIADERAGVRAESVTDDQTRATRESAIAAERKVGLGGMKGVIDELKAGKKPSDIKIAKAEAKAAKAAREADVLLDVDGKGSTDIGTTRQHENMMKKGNFSDVLKYFRSVPAALAGNDTPSYSLANWRGAVGIDQGELTGFANRPIGELSDQDKADFLNRIDEGMRRSGYNHNGDDWPKPLADAYSAIVKTISYEVVGDLKYVFEE